MPPKCSICTHPKKAHINRALASGKKSLRAIAGQYGVSRQALTRHKAHITKSLQTAKKNGAIKEGKSVYDRVMSMIAQAEEKFNGTTGTLQVQWFRELRGMIETLGKFAAEAERERQVYSDVTPAVLEIIEKEFET